MTKEKLRKDYGGIVKTYSKPHDRQFYKLRKQYT